MQEMEKNMQEMEKNIQELLHEVNKRNIKDREGSQRKGIEDNSKNNRRQINKRHKRIEGRRGYKQA